MTLADLGPAVENAVTSRVRDVVESVDGETSRSSRPADGQLVIGIRTRQQPVWNGPSEVRENGHHVRFLACPSVLAVLDALADPAPSGDTYSVLVILTDREPGELGDAVMARFHREKLYDVSKYTLLQDLLRTRQLDPRLRGSENAWLVDALVDLARSGQLPRTTGLAFSRTVAVGHVLRNRLALEPEDLDLTRLVTAMDNTPTRLSWRDLADEERSGLEAYLVERLGRPAEVVVRLATERDDVLAELLVADALTRAPENDPEATGRHGAFVHSRFGSREPSRKDLATAADRAVDIAISLDTERVWQQVRRADVLLVELNGARFALYSRILPSGFGQRLERAALSLNEGDLTSLEQHRAAGENVAQVRRLRAAVRLRRWLSTPQIEPATIATILRSHARELAWVDRELNQIRQGAAQADVARALAEVTAKAGARRAWYDQQLSRVLAETAHTCPSGVLGVESFLPEVIAPMARKHRILLIVVDGMSGAVATEITDSVVRDRRSGWTEVVRADDGGRDCVLATFPTETEYSRTSLFCAKPRQGTAADELRSFSRHAFWPPNTHAVLVHKAGLRGSEGADLGAELEAEFAAQHQRQVLAVVLNAVDDSLGAGRQSDDPAWNYRDVPGLPQLLNRASDNGWLVVLTSDHGHILEHGSRHHPDSTGGARWRAPHTPVSKKEVMLTGPRVLTSDGGAILAVAEDLRYGKRSHGYHGGGALAEVAIPLVVLLPPGMTQLDEDGWAVHSMGPPDWWTGQSSRSTPPAASTRQGRKPKRAMEPPAGQAELFTKSAKPGSRGELLVSSEIFVNTHKGMPPNRVPRREVFSDVVDALVAAGDRLPVADVLRTAKTPGRNPRALVSALARVLNVDQFAVIELIDGDRTVRLNQQLLDEQFPLEET
jgi:hypothetical protein